MIDLEKVSHFLFTACCKVKEENKAKTGVFLEKNSNIEYSSLKEDFDVNDLSYRNKDHWEDGANRGV